MVAYELFSSTSPRPNRNYDDANLALKIFQGLRPNLDKLTIPQLLKNLIKSCWVSCPEKRPNAKELYKKIQINELLNTEDSDLIIDFTNELEWQKQSETSLHSLQE
ncbi:22660_t:CDS:2, partial [Gigaspora margarita]